MRIFDEEFDIRSYIKKRLLEIDNLESRRVFTSVVEGLFLELHGEIEAEYKGLEQRVFEELPMPVEGPAIVTTIIDRRLYDVTDDFLLPMRPEDMRPHQVDAEALLTSLNEKSPFFLYTVFLQADHLEACQFDRPERNFRGVIKTRHSEYTARFHVSRNLSYRRQIEDLYRIFNLNYLPWRSVCAPYLYKLFDVYIDGIENWNAQESIEEAVIDFEEYAPAIRYHQVPLWNLETVAIRTSTYPEPCVDKINYEHRIFRHKFQEDARYLVTNSDVSVANIRWTKGDLLITCPLEDPVTWEMYQCNPQAKREYPNRLMGNAKQASFADTLMGVFRQPIKTKLELSRLIQACGYERDLTFAGVELVANFPDKETYIVDDFIRDELRTGTWETAMRLDFQPADYDFYLNRDIMSFLVGVVQRHFPEYECCGRLV
jgi:hypothetical protein